MNFISAALRIVKSTHRHPANIALHAAGLPLYGAGIATMIMATGSGAFAGAALVSIAVGMFVAGHAIEGNVISMTPVLLARLAWRRLSRRQHPGKDSVHLLRR